MDKIKYAFFLDIDGTLVANGIIPSENIKAINEARNRGNLVFINTARSLSNMQDVTNSLVVDGLITGLGSCIVADGKKILSKRIDIDELALLFDRYNNMQTDIVFEGEEYMLGNIEDWDNLIILHSGEDLKLKYSDTPIAKVYFPGILPDAEQKYLSKRYNFFQHAHYAEFAPIGCSKADGIDFVCDKYKIDKSHCVAMGDSANDIDMMNHAGISVAMGNSTDEVKAICDFVTCDAKDGGVAEGIRLIIDK